jgi:predicted PurR-regulated permease PerM
MKKEGGNLDRKAEKSFLKYILLIIVLLMMFLSYRIISNYVLVLVSAFLLAYLVKPLHLFLSKRINKMASAWVCLILLFVILIIPLTLVITQISTQIYSAINSVDVENAIGNLEHFEILENIGINFKTIFDKIGSFIFSLVSDLVLKIPTLIFSFIIFIFAFIYALYDWKKISTGLKDFIPFGNKEKTIRELDDSTHGIVYGYFIIALLDFVVSLIGFYFLGVKFYLVLAFLVAILAFIPGLGPMMAMLPLLIYYLFLGNWINATVSLMLWIVLSLGVETILKTKILGDRSNIHPLVMILGIMGGTSLFGLFGFIIGPLLLVYTMKLIQGILGTNQSL